MSKARRSGRISRQVPVLLLGTDTWGRVFSEETSTLVLSRHGAGILSRHKLTPDERLTLRQVGCSPEAEVRLVGGMGQQGDAYVYGIEFTDPNVNFWQLEFPPASAPSDPPPGVTLECSLCGSRQTGQHSDIEADVYAVNDSILRCCEACGISTNWRSAKPDAALASPEPVPASSPLAPVLAIANSSLLNAAIQQIEIELDPYVRQTAALCAAVFDVPATSAPSASAAARPGGSGVNRRRDVRTSVNSRRASARTFPETKSLNATTSPRAELPSAAAETTSQVRVSKLPSRTLPAVMSSSLPPPSGISRSCRRVFFATAWLTQNLLNLSSTSSAFAAAICPLSSHPLPTLFFQDHA